MLLIGSLVVYNEIFGKCFDAINIAMILTHYHHPNKSAFQSLSSLSDSEALRVIVSLQNFAGDVYRRFRDPEKYLVNRQVTEAWLRQEFIKKGGQPLADYPQYFVVGRSPRAQAKLSAWIEEGYNGQFEMVQLPITDLPTTQISFTYPDSMISYWLQSQAGQDFHHPEYHGQVFNYSEICQIIDRFGVPDEKWRTKAVHKHDLFIEAQAWVNESWLLALYKHKQ
jgi:hypothetical protein